MGDRYADKELMNRLGAKESLVGDCEVEDIKEFAMHIKNKGWKVELPPREVLNKLYQEGYRFLGQSASNDRHIWTLFKEN